MPPSVAYKWQGWDYLFRFLVSARFGYVLGLVVLSLGGALSSPLFHFVQLVDFARLPQAQRTQHHPPITRVCPRPSARWWRCTRAGCRS